ncbi:phosphotransferase [Streptomyces sp. NPDC002889]|uniref:phosphotransferase n=1 Tax=Streptomyces sp. NPDC002889 TaxID=3364669 RepID=UPI0036AB3A89
MTVDAASETRRWAAGLSQDAQLVEGPLEGYHHEAYAFPLPTENPLADRFQRGKVRSPRPGLLWFDRRFFASEDRLLIALHGRISRIPECCEIAPDVCLQGFIEGRTLGSRPFANRPLDDRHLQQLGRLFAELAAIGPDELEAGLGGSRADCPVDGDSAAFLSGLIHFTEYQVHRRHSDEFGALFRELGVPDDPLVTLRQAAEHLTPRPFTLLHADLHRNNLIVDSAGDLWTIDWELAMIGDPLYELATHVHLMRYSRKEAARTTEVWQEAVERSRAGSSKGLEQDLPVLLAYKRVQSVITDVIRTAVALTSREKPSWQSLPAAAWQVHYALKAAAEPLGLSKVPTPWQVMAVYRHWLRARSAP